MTMSSGGTSVFILYRIINLKINTIYTVTLRCGRSIKSVFYLVFMPDFLDFVCGTITYVRHTKNYRNYNDHKANCR